MDNFADMLKDILFGKRGETIRDEVEGYIIDTVELSTVGYETAICKDDGDWVVVARYKDRERAVKGHKIWMIACAAKPNQVFSIQTGNYEIL